MARSDKIRPDVGYHSRALEAPAALLIGFLILYLAATHN